MDSIQQRTSVETPVLSIFNSQIYQPADSETSPREISEHLCEFAISIPRELSDSGNHTILDALETSIWGGSKPACLKLFSDILLIQLKRDDREDGAGVEILPRLPLSRFAVDFYQETEEKIRFRKGIKDTLENLRKREDMLTWVEKAGQKYHATQVLEATIQYVEGMEGKTIFDGDLEDDENSSRMDIDSESTLPAITAQLKSSLEALNQKLQGTSNLEFAHLDIQSSTANMQNKLTTIFDFPDFITRPPPNTEDPNAPSTRISLIYVLRGVLIDQHLTYFSQWEQYTNPYKRKLKWFKSDFSLKHEIATVEEGEVLTIARERGSDGITTVYVREDVPEVFEEVLPPDYLRVCLLYS